MERITRLAAVAAASLAVAIAACRGPTFVVQQYPGAARPATSIAIVRTNGNDAAKLATLDEEDVSSPLDVDSRLHIEILPGRHTVGVVNANAPSERPPPAAFVAEAGKMYRVTLVSGSAHVFEVEREGDALVREVTVADVIVPAGPSARPEAAPVRPAADAPLDGGVTPTDAASSD